MARPHVLVVSFGILGMVNPSLRLAQRLAATGADVTFAAPLSSHRAAAAAQLPGVTFAPFSDGHDSGYPFGSRGDSDRYDSEIRLRGSRAVAELISDAELAGKPFACVVYTPVVTWAADVAEGLGTPAVLLWVQAATAFDVVHAYFHGYGDLIEKSFAAKEYDKVLTELEPLGLPVELAVRDLPNFMDASNPEAYFAKYFREDLGRFEQSGPKRTVLVNTFDSLELVALRCMESKGVRLIGIGPLVDPPRIDSSDPTMEWLREREKGSVVYVSFGSLSVLAEKQMDEVARALVEFGRPFVWVVRGEMPRQRWIDELEGLGVIVPWCDQVAVLESGVVGCFVTHCGWNSTLESLAAGVPMVGFPQRMDQLTNAKLAEDYWKVGARVCADEGTGVAEGDEIKRCLELVHSRVEFSRNAEKWKGLAREALREGGSSRANLEDFLSQVTL